MPVDVTEDTFQQAVIEESKKRPVLVDFWASWCGPCRMLGPILEKVEASMSGKFLLAKIDTEASPRISQGYGISSIPAVKLFSGGIVVDEFVGALPEPAVLKFLEKHIPDEQVMELESLSHSNPLEAADQVLEKSIQSDKGAEMLWFGAAFLLATQPDGWQDKIHNYLRAIPDIGHPRSDARNSLLHALESSPAEDSLKAMGKVLDPETNLEGLDFFLEKVQNTSGKERDHYKDQIVACFQILGNSGEIVNDYRKRLARLLY